MKQFRVLFGILFIAIVSSCNKSSSPQKLLLGTWQVTKTVITAGIGNYTADSTVEPETDTFYVFETDGTGRLFTLNYNRSFSYVFNHEIDNIIFTYEDGKSSSSIVDVLTEDTLIMHSSSSGTITGIAFTGNSQVFCTKVK